MQRGKEWLGSTQETIKENIEGGEEHLWQIQA